MAIVLGSYDELTDFGVLTRPELADLLDTMAAEELEERFIKHGTVILFKGGPMLQAVKVRGTAAGLSTCCRDLAARSPDFDASTPPRRSDCWR